MDIKYPKKGTSMFLSLIVLFLASVRLVYLEPISWITCRSWNICQVGCREPPLNEKPGNGESPRAKWSIFLMRWWKKEWHVHRAAAHRCDNWFVSQAEGTATPCFVTQELDRSSMNNHEDDETIKNVAATTYAGNYSCSKPDSLFMVWLVNSWCRHSSINNLVIRVSHGYTSGYPGKGTEWAGQRHRPTVALLYGWWTTSIYRKLFLVDWDIPLTRHLRIVFVMRLVPMHSRIGSLSPSIC